MPHFTILIAVSALGGLTFLLATLLIVANRKLFVAEDPRIDRVDDMLPRNNCGGCGYPSCRAFAEALVAGEVLPGQCGVASEEQRVEIATFLNVDVGAQIKQVARLACAGGDNVARHRADYLGIPTCVSANQVGGGDKDCAWGCMGYGDCAKVCTFDAIHLDRHGLPVVDVDKCTACGDCVDICPKNLFSLQPVNHCLWVACKNLEMGDRVLESCQVGCTACGRCVVDAPQRHIQMHDNLPVIDYSRSLAGREAIERCPTGAIVWVEPNGKIVKGDEAPRILRESPLPTATT